jgi:hypothetical protein
MSTTAFADTIGVHRRRRLLVFGVHIFLHDNGKVAAELSPLRYGTAVRDLTLLRALAGRCDSSYRRGDELVCGRAGSASSRSRLTTIAESA